MTKVLLKAASSIGIAKSWGRHQMWGEYGVYTTLSGFLLTELAKVMICCTNMVSLIISDRPALGIGTDTVRWHM